MSDPELLLQLDQVETGFGANKVLHGCSYEVRRGEVVTVLGLNGAGKSVSLKVAAGLLPAWSGRVVFEGEDVTKLPVETRVARGIGHVTQGRQVFPDLTVEQNLRLGAYVLRRKERARYRSVLESIYDRFPVLGERREQLGGTLSGGQQAMLAVARGLMSEPKLLVIDEPSAGLSPAAVADLFDILEKVHASGVTILMVEQNVTFALKFADRVNVMQQGRIVYEGEVGSVDPDKLAHLLGIGRLLQREVAATTQRRSTLSPTTA